MHFPFFPFCTDMMMFDGGMLKNVWMSQSKLPVFLRWCRPCLLRYPPPLRLQRWNSLSFKPWIPFEVVGSTTTASFIPFHSISCTPWYLRDLPNLFLRDNLCFSWRCSQKGMFAEGKHLKSSQLCLLQTLQRSEQSINVNIWQSVSCCIQTIQKCHSLHSSSVYFWLF